MEKDLKNAEKSSEDRKIEGHNYDGIEELDNSLPTWWINLFYLTMIFAALYFSYYVIGEGPGLLKEYRHARNDFEAAQLAQTSSQKVATEEELRSLLKKPEIVQTGKALFASKCVSCHGEQGQGGIGPNLTDDYWIHGGKMADILKVISQGVLDKGMPPWGSLLKQDEVYSLVAFVKSLKGTHPPNPKAPQGVLVKE